MKPSAVHSNAIIAVKEKLLMNQNRIKRMIAAADYAAAAKVLVECGYNENIITRQGDFENFIINDEFKKTVETFVSLCNDEALLDCVLSRFDYHNAAAIYIGGHTEPEALYPFGAIELSKMKSLIAAKKYNDLPQSLESALKALDLISAPTVSEVNTAIHNALRERTEIISRKIKSPLLRNYFDTLQHTAEQSSPESDPEILFLKLNNNTKADVFDLYLLFHWFIMKQTEFKVVKAILISKKLGLSREKTRELIRGVYDCFK